MLKRKRGIQADAGASLVPPNLPLEDDLRTQVRTFFGNLPVKYGFTEVGSEYSEASFGNAMLVYQSDNLNLKFVRERGQVFVDVSGPRGLWIELQVIKDLLVGSDRPAMTLPDLKELGQFLEAHHHDVIAMLGNDKRAELQKRIEKYRLTRGQIMFGHLLPPDYFNDLNKP